MTTENHPTPGDELTPERLVIDERIAVLRAVKCPGKTHTSIKNPELRRAYALELNGVRNHAILQNYRKMLSTDEFWRGVRFGLESAFWSMQKLENRTFINEGRRVTWHLREPEEHRSPEERQRY